MTSDVYNRVFTMHGVIMVFFFLIPSIPATLGNFLLPIMIGAKDLAFPQHQPAQLVHLRGRRPVRARRRSSAAASTPAGRSTRRTARWPRNTRVLTGAVGVFIAGFSSILTGLNFIVTIHRMRAPGMTWFRLPLFVWAHYATSLIMILGTPVVAITILLRGVRARAARRHLRPDDRRRPGALPAPVLVLLAPGGLHHGAAGHGRHQRAHRRLLAQEHLRLQLRRLLEPGDRGHRLPGVGPPHVRGRRDAVLRRWCSRSSPTWSPCRRR